MCSYCGCESEPLISALTDDHSAIADLSYRIGDALDRCDKEAVQQALAELSERFDRHSRREEAGLFAELDSSAAVAGELARLRSDHRRLRRILASTTLADRPCHLRDALADLELHARVEDNDLFPYALQVLPATSWDRANSMVPTPAPGG